MFKTKLAAILGIFLSLSTVLITLPTNSVVYATGCSSIGPKIAFEPPLGNFQNDQPYTVTYSNVDSGDYELQIDATSNNRIKGSASGGKVSFSVPGSSAGTHTAFLLKWYDGSFIPPRLPDYYEYCTDSFTVRGFTYSTCRVSINPTDPRTSEQIRVDVQNAPAGDYWILPDSNLATGLSKYADITIGADGRGTAAIGPFDPGNYSFKIVANTLVYSDSMCKKSFNVSTLGTENPRPLPAPGSGGSGTGGVGFQPCTGSQCVQSTGGEGCSGEDQVNTVLGCVSTAPQNLISSIVTLLVGLSGGIALILMILGSFKMIFSMGDPEAVRGGRQQFISATIGLIFIILSVTILKIIGVDILHLF